MNTKGKIILISSICVGVIAVSFVGGIILSNVLYQNFRQKELEELYQKEFEFHYQERVNDFTIENETLHDVDISFVGDSLTEGYDVKTYYPDFNVVNRGIGGDTTTGVLGRMKESIYDVNPKITSLLIGANNFKTMFNDYEDILKGMKENMPNIKVVLCSLTSMTKEWGRNNEIAKENNVRIKTLADSYGYTYVDLYNPLLDESTNELRLEYTTDGGHLTSAGYEKVTSVLTPVYTSLLN